MDKISESSEVKGVALNLTHSPEKGSFWERADPIRSGAGHAASALIDERKADTPGSKTASSCPTTGK